MLGTVIGALLVSLIGNTMNLSNISAFVQLGVKGLLLLAVVSLQRRKEIGL
ncbi:L-arabinose transporter permease protein [compost metagenome]